MIITTAYLMTLFITLAFTVIGLLLDSEFFTRHFTPKFLRSWRRVILTLLVLLIVYLCYENFAVTLTLLVFVTGLISLLDRLLWAKKRQINKRPLPVIVENARAFFGVLLLVWVIRSFIVQPYRVPTGSLAPTVMPGDLIIANQFTYGLRFPIMNWKMVKVGEPKIGDIVLFYFPRDPQILFVKRVIGTPGDHVAYKNKVLYVNGKEAKQTLLAETYDVEPGQDPIPADLKSEQLPGVTHDILLHKNSGIEGQDFELTVPAGMYFMMGDNRDNSDDSRIWGFVPEKNIVGRAFRILFSWDSILNRVQWNRIGKAIR